jgi:hypothetical protein
MTRKLIALAMTPFLLAACSHAPHKEVARQEDVAGIGPRPAVFGRHAWDAQQAAARAKGATPAPAAPAQPAPPPPAPVLAQAEPSPPPAAPSPPPQLAAPPVPSPPVLPRPPEPPPVPVVQAAPVPPPPAIKSEKPVAEKHAKAPKPPKVAKEKAPLKLPFGLTPIAAPPPPPPLVGGYGEPSDKKAVEAAAAFAVHESPGYELKGVYSAKTQVVAGTNYSLCLWVRQIRHEANPLKRRLVAATVFQGLDGHYELNHWHEVPDCHAGT